MGDEQFQADDMKPVQGIKYLSQLASNMYAYALVVSSLVSFSLSLSRDNSRTLVIFITRSCRY